MPEETFQTDAFTLPRKAKLPGPHIVAFVLFCTAFGVFLIFFLPWQFPPQTPITSESYDFGYSNFVAWLGLLFLLTITLFWRLLLKNRLTDQILLCRLLANTKPVDEPSQKIATGIVTILTLSAVVSWWWIMPLSYCGETHFFLSRLDLMLDGLQPYRDFEFGYGPLMLYLPYFLHKASAGILPIDSSYILSVLLFFALGFWLLHRIVASFSIDKTTRLACILLCGAASFNLTLGIMYTPTRYLWPIFAGFTAWRMLEDLTVSFSLKKLAWAAGMIFLLSLAGFSITPDTGTTTALALSAAIMWTTLFRDLRAGMIMPVPVLSVGAVWAIFGQSYFGLFVSFGGGGYNFPIVPAPYILLLLACALWIVPAIAAGAFAHRTANGGLYAALTICLGLPLPAALGRCDSGHVFWNGLGIFLFAGCAASLTQGKLIRRTTFVIALIFAGFLMQNFWSFYGEPIEEQLRLRKQLTENRTALEASSRKIIETLKASNEYKPFPWEKKPPLPASFFSLLQFPRIATPLGSAENVERFLKISGRYVPEYHVGPFDGAFSKAHAERKIRELGNVEYVMIPTVELANLGDLDMHLYSKLKSAALSSLFLWPVNFTAVKRPFHAKREVLLYLNNHYISLQTVGNYTIFERKDLKAKNITPESVR